jgi:hypothetical protein
VLKNKSLESTSQSIFAGEMMIVVKMVDALAVLDIAKIDIACLGSPLEVEKLRIDVFVLKPPLVSQSLPQLVVSSFHDVNFLVVTATVSFLPSRHVHILLFLLIIFLFLSAVNVNVISVLDLRFLGKIDCRQRLGLVLKTF